MRAVCCNAQVLRGLGCSATSGSAELGDKDIKLTANRQCMDAECGGAREFPGDILVALTVGCYGPAPLS